MGAFKTLVFVLRSYRKLEFFSYLASMSGVVCVVCPFADGEKHLAGKEAGTNRAHRSVNRLASYHRGIYSRLGFMFAAPRSAGRLLVGR